MKEDEANDGTARWSHSSTIDIDRQERKKWFESLIVDANKSAIGLYTNFYIDNKLRMKLLKELWIPLTTYDFKKSWTMPLNEYFVVNSSQLTYN